MIIDDSCNIFLDLVPLEQQVNGMGPLIDAELELVDRRYVKIYHIREFSCSVAYIYITKNESFPLIPLNKILDMRN